MTTHAPEVTGVIGAGTIVVPFLFVDVVVVTSIGVELSTFLYTSTITCRAAVVIPAGSDNTDVSGVTDAELKKLIKEDKVILIDVRNPNEWKKGGIKAQRSVQISRGFLEVKYPKLILSKYKKDDAFVIYCAIEPRAILATKRLKDLGFTNVKYLKGGFKNWSK